MQATKKPHNYHKTVVWQKDDRIRKSPLKFYVYYYSELSGDCQVSIFTELWRLSVAFCVTLWHMSICTCTMACWITLSMTVGTPRFLTPPLSLGISTLLTGEGLYFLVRICSLMASIFSSRYPLSSLTVIPSIPGAPLFLLTCLYAFMMFSSLSISSNNVLSVFNIRYLHFFACLRTNFHFHPFFVYSWY